MELSKIIGFSMSTKILNHTMALWQRNRNGLIIASNWKFLDMTVSPCKCDFLLDKQGFFFYRTMALAINMHQVW